MEEKHSNHAHPHHESPRDTGSVKSAFDTMPPKFAFWAGFISAIALFSLVGFVVMASLMVNGGGSSATKNTNQVAAANTNAAPAANTNAAAAPAVPTGTVKLGDITNWRGDGDITIVEWSDTECPFCKRFHPTMKDQVMKDYAGKVRWGYKQYPLSIHPKANQEVIATECAAEQGKFWEYIDIIYEKTPSNNGLAEEELGKTADEVGLDRGKFDECLSSEKYQDKVNKDMAEAEALGFTGTPYSLVVDGNGKILDVISGAQPYEAIKTILDKYVK